MVLVYISVKLLLLQFLCCWASRAPSLCVALRKLHPGQRSRRKRLIARFTQKQFLVFGPPPPLVLVCMTPGHQQTINTGPSHFASFTDSLSAATYVLAVVLFGYYSAGTVPSSSVMTTRQSLTRSSTSWSLSAARSKHSDDAARSAIKASNDNRRHARLVTTSVLAQDFLTHSRNRRRA